MTATQQKGYNGNSNLKGVNTQINWTPEQIQEYAKCVNDPIYFIENYVKVVTLDYGLQQMMLYPYQKEYIKALHTENRIVAMWFRQSGKCCQFQAYINIRNKSTGDEYYLPIGDFHLFIKDASHDISKFKLSKRNHIDLSSLGINQGRKRITDCL